MWWQAALLGVVQGLTEFLPISSSAHLILARAFFGWDTAQFGIGFDVAVHVGTLAAVVLYFARDLANMVLSLPRVLAPQGDQTVRQIRLIAAGTLPLVPAGLLYTDAVEGFLRTPAVSAAMLAGGAALLLLAERVGRRSRPEHGLSLAQAFGLGLAQAAALAPGVSRSGATITLALFFGLRRDAAARFSFLLGVPAILAAAALTAVEAASRDVPGGGAPLPAVIVGVLTSAVVGYLTVKYFLRYLQAHSLRVFAYYRFALAAATGVWLLLGRS